MKEEEELNVGETDAATIARRDGVSLGSTGQRRSCSMCAAHSSSRVSRSIVAAANREETVSIVCVSPTEDLICETCRTRIRADALEQKRREERPGRRGASV